MKLTFPLTTCSSVVLTLLLANASSERPARCGREPTATETRIPQTLHSSISKLDTPSRITRRCWSIFHSAYSSRVAMTARRCSGPTLPFLASSCDRQMHVARFRKSWFGSPNQYLSSESAKVRPRTSHRVSKITGRGEVRKGRRDMLTSEIPRSPWPLRVTPCPAPLDQDNPCSA